MNKMSFLFGLGLGITLVSLIFFYSYTSKRKSFENQISLLNTEVSELRNNSSPKPVGTPVVTPTPDSSNTPSATPSSVATPPPSDTPAPSEVPEEQTPPQSPTVSIEIIRGMSAKEVCQMLEQAGVISDAAELQRYIRENNSSAKMMTGMHAFTVGMSFEDILAELKR